MDDSGEVAGAPTDEILMARVQRGDERAFSMLMARHLDGVHRYAARMMNASHEAEDVAQESLVRVWSRASQWQPDRVKFTTWLYRIAHNLCIDRFRRTRRDQPLTDDHELAGAPDTAERLIGKRADERRLRIAIDGLPERQRTALVLCFFEGFSNQEAASILDVKLEALESLLARARRTLKLHLKPTDPDDVDA